MEFPRPGAETRDETELEMRVWPVAEKSDKAGEAGAEVLRVKGESGRRGESVASRESRASE